jgi:mRNA interferase RelE/StbE
MAKKPKKYEIDHTPAAERDLKKLKNNSIVLGSLVATILALKENPRPNGCKHLTGIRYRVRDGEYRIIYEIDDTTKRILITRVRDRKDVYKD